MSGQSGFDPLASARYVLMTSFRRDGTPVRTPLGPLARDGKLYFITRSDTGKLKRIRRNPAVDLAPCDRRGNVLGASRAGQARILDRASAAAIADAFRRKWGWQWYLMRALDRLRGKTRIIIEVEPGAPSDAAASPTGARPSINEAHPV